MHRAYTTQPISGCRICECYLRSQEKVKQMEEKIKDASEQMPSADGLVTIAIFLEGIKLGKGGNIQPLGNIEIDNLWRTIRFLRNMK